tara:strand:+ start:288 stop:524 length:237 start_codon:yes stop_codon:yes gene_type:complete
LGVDGFTLVIAAVEGVVVTVITGFLPMNLSITTGRCLTAITTAVVIDIIAVIAAFPALLHAISAILCPSVSTPFHRVA